MRIEINTLTKAQIESRLNDMQINLTRGLSKTIDKKFKEKEEEKTELEKKALKKQSEKSDEEWYKIKNKDLRLSEIEHKIINLEGNTKDFLNSFTLKFNEMVDKFNNHIKNGTVKK
jgi:hypothetical protein